MEDVWDGRVWNEFPESEDGGEVFTKKSGNLVFSLYLDWFNAEGSSSLGAHNSIGSITLICLNLPPEERYKISNIFLFGVIPGPKEPSLEQVNHLLSPLVTELQSFWKGVRFKSTALHASGRVIRAAVFPLIADLPALRKTAGFGSHAATLFCSFCLTDKKEIEEIDPAKFPPRLDDQHLLHAREWLALDTYQERKKFMKKYGARWSVLNDLPYWRPVEYCSIELMHSLILGDLKDHSMRFLSLPLASKQLKSSQDKEEEWQMDDHYTSLPFAELFPTQEKKERGKRKRDDNADEEAETLRPPKRGRNSQPSSSLKGKQREQTDDSSSNSQTTSEHSSHTTQGSHSYNLRVRKEAVYNNCVESPDTKHSEDESNSDGTERGPKRTKSLTPLEQEGGVPHRLRPHELEVVRRTLIHTMVPSWIDRVPHNLGSASHGSLKAAEWLILYKVYYTIALVPIWSKAYVECATGEEKERLSFLLESTTLLSTISHFLTLPQIDPKDLPELDGLIMRYRKCLHQGWPGQPSKPNLHLTQHYSEVIRRFGPPRSTAAWAQERVNGMLQRLPTNHHPCKSDVS